MGNAAGVPVSPDVPVADSLTKYESVITMTTAEEENEAERLFREKFGTISIIQKNASQTGAEEDHADDISSLHQHTWATTVASTMDEEPSSRSYKHGSNYKGQSQENSQESNSTMGSATVTTTSQGDSAVIPESVVQRQPTPIRKETSLLRQSHNKLRSNNKIFNFSETTVNDSTKQQSVFNNRNLATPVVGTKHMGKPRTASSKVTPTNTKNKHKNNTALKDIQKKMAQVDLGQNSCLDQIKTMNHEMDAYRRTSLRKLQERDNAIDLNMTEIAFLKQQMLQVKTEYQDHLSLIKMETRKVMRKLMSVQTHMKVVELEKDAAVKEVLAMKAKATKAAVKSNGGTPDASNKPIDTVQDPTATSNSSSTKELEQTIHDLLQQLRDSEDAHQREQDTMCQEVLDMRKKLEQKESEYIAVERERDDARQQIDIRNQHLELEKALHASAEKQHFEEINTWKNLYEQEMRFKPQNCQESASRLRTKAATLGSRLGKGILQGIQEEDNRSRASTAMTVNSLEDDNSDSYYTNMVGQVEYVTATKLLTRSSVTSYSSHCGSSIDSGGILEHSAANAPMMPPLEQSGTCLSAPTYVPDGPNGKASTEAFQEAISIPNFLSKVW